MELTKNQEGLQKAVMTAWEDAEFKKELLANPVKAIESLTGEKFEIPSGKEFIVIDSTDNSKIYFHLPTKESIMEIELTDEQLEMVAGGGMTIPTITTIIDSCFCSGDMLV
ncbi:hypothetical protein FVB9288_02335 [Flavobacterium sp. CECT 9288]|uniref:NHLP leader peptide family RiPP precursor n=1 Tax=Flavobacterium sp. CECT 9288 TaxID=2845819 RepID=UPI001E713463|nr:NHLP leader peptide family RiPP precursor [Flavobacterium sp. CECT 9288]CAH0336627.1 hypothetical protein FVB9288_02335 [Flavobacterium sp. CECT 9288]